MNKNSYEAIVIGSGATGGVAAQTLAKEGVKVLVIEAGPKSNLPQKEIDYRVEQWDRFPTIQAVKDKRIHFISADYILIPGPRLVKILEKFAKVIHPDLSYSEAEKRSFQETVKP